MDFFEFFTIETLGRSNPLRISHLLEIQNYLGNVYPFLEAGKNIRGNTEFVNGEIGANSHEELRTKCPATALSG
jgi:hypothetical protein